MVKVAGQGRARYKCFIHRSRWGEIVRFAAILIDKGHVAAHNGVGAVMGSKKLKAIAVLHGKKKAEVKDRGRLTGLVKAFLKPIINNPASYHYYGTLPGFLKNLAIGNLPIKNYTTTKWSIPEDQLSRFSGPYIRGRPLGSNLVG